MYLVIRLILTSTLPEYNRTGLLLFSKLQATTYNNNLISKICVSDLIIYPEFCQFSRISVDPDNVTNGRISKHNWFSNKKMFFKDVSKHFSLSFECSLIHTSDRGWDWTCRGSRTPFVACSANVPRCTKKKKNIKLKAIERVI